MFGKINRIRSGKDETSASMTPMVDVTFLLLIFFVVTASFQLQKAIATPHQQTDAPSPNQVDQDQTSFVELQVDEHGAFYVLAQAWEAETPGKQNLIAKLKEAKSQFAPNELVTLQVKIHEAARLQSLVDAMDAGTIAAYQQLQVTQVDQFN